MFPSAIFFDINIIKRSFLNIWKLEGDKVLLAQNFLHILAGIKNGSRAIKVGLIPLKSLQIDLPCVKISFQNSIFSKIVSSFVKFSISLSNVCAISWVVGQTIFYMFSLTVMFFACNSLRTAASPQCEQLIPVIFVSSARRNISQASQSLCVSLM